MSTDYGLKRSKDPTMSRTQYSPLQKTVILPAIGERPPVNGYVWNWVNGFITYPRIHWKYDCMKTIDNLTLIR